MLLNTLHILENILTFEVKSVQIPCTCTDWNILTKFIYYGSTCNYSAKEPVCRNGSPLSDESKDGIKRGLSVFPCRVGNGMESVEGIGAGIGTEAT